jgi:hypothetical protein
MNPSRPPLVSIRKIHARRRDVEELLAVPGGRIGQVDDVHDLGPPKRVICTARMLGG